MLLAYRCHNIVIDITTLSSISRVIKVGWVGVGVGVWNWVWNHAFSTRGKNATRGSWPYY